MVLSDPIRVLVVEDDRLTREALRQILEGSPGYGCLAAFDAVEAAMVWRGAVAPDVVLLDVQLPGVPGPQGAAMLRERWPEAAIVMLTAFEDEEVVFQSLCNGATGYILKHTPPTRVLDAVREARDGGAPMSPEIASKVVRLFRRLPPPPRDGAALTSQEVRLLALLAEGCSYQGAADQMHLSINTVRTYITRIYEKLHVHGKAEAVSKALRAGLF
jgi:DNA-binding NarL/FixJ family response regulator